MYQTSKILLILTLFFVVFAAGCSKRDPNPELRDPIFLDLKDIVGDLTRDVSTFEATASDEREKLANAEPNTKDLALAKKRLHEAKINLNRARQKLKYYEIKLKRRKLETRASYEKAHQEGRDWPDPGEFRAYQANKKLRNANSQWSSRVPKLKDRIQKFNAQQKVNPSTGSGGGDGH